MLFVEMSSEGVCVGVRGRAGALVGAVGGPSHPVLPLKVHRILSGSSSVLKV